MKASFAQLSITEGRHKIQRLLNKGETVKVQATVIIKPDWQEGNLDHDEDDVFDYTTGIVRDVKHID